MLQLCCFGGSTIEKLIGVSAIGAYRGFYNLPYVGNVTWAVATFTRLPAGAVAF